MKRSGLVTAVLIVAAMVALPLGCWVGPLGGVICVPAPYAHSGPPERRLEGSWLLTSEAFSSSLLVFERGGQARAVSLTDSAVFFESTRVRSLSWAVDGGTLSIGGHSESWSEAGTELVIGCTEHRDVFRRQWCVGE